MKISALKLIKPPLVVVLYILLLAILASLAVFAFYFYRPYQDRLSSVVEVSSTDQGLNFQFNLAASDKAGFFNLVKNLGVTWSGEDLLVGLNDSFQNWFKEVTPLEIGLKPEASGLKFSLALDNLPQGEGQEAWGKIRFAPSQTLLYGQIPNASEMVSLPGEEVLLAIEKTLTIIAFPTEKEIDFALIGKIINRVKLESELSKLKNIESKSDGRTEGAGAGYNESKVEDVSYYSITSADSSFVPSFGIVGENLVVGSNPEAFIKILKTVRGEEASLSNQDFFRATMAQVPPGSVGSLYLNLRQLKGVETSALLKLLKPYLDLEVSQEFEPILSTLVRLDSVGVVWSKEGAVQGYLALP